MNVVISAANVKTFFSALQCLSRFSEAFWLQANPQENGKAQVRLSAINSTNSAFCMFVFDHDFFLRASVPSNQRVECQLMLKAVLSILRTRGRTVERCELDLVDESQECRFAIKLHCHHGVLKTHKLTYEPKRGLLPTADPNPPNYFCINAQTGHEWTEHFLSTAKNGEITFWCGPEFCIVKSKEDEPSEVKGSMRKAIHTEVRIDLADFRDYQVANKALLTFSLREFKATVTLAETLQVPLEVSFSDGDDPLFIRSHVESFSAEFVIATTREKPQDAVGNATAKRPPSRSKQSQHSTMPPPSARPRAQRTQADESMPSASRLDAQVEVPVESTPTLPAERGQSPPPLFFPDSSQESMAGGEQAANGAEDTLDDMADIIALEEVERAIEQGNTELRGSQLVLRETSVEPRGVSTNRTSATERMSRLEEDDGSHPPAKKFKPLFS